MAPFQFLRAEGGFFERFEQGAATARDAARLLRALLADYRDVEGRVLKITELEHQGDDIVRETLELLGQSFITPLDGDEIRAIVGSIDDVIDLIEEGADALLLYEVKESIPEALHLADLLLQMTEQLVGAMPLLRDRQSRSHIRPYTVEVNRLENEADRVLRLGIARLVRQRSGDLFELLRWKEILEKLEDATDKCEDVADVLATVVQKEA